MTAAREGMGVRAPGPRPAVAVLLLALLVLAIHGRTLGPGYGWTFDDHRFIALNPWVREPDSWLRAFTDMTTTDPGAPAAIVRPLRTLEFALDAAWFGLSPAAFRAHSLLWFSAGGAFLFLLLRDLLGDARAAFAGAALWIAHPMQTEVADLVSSRGDAASGALVLAAAWMAVRSRARDAWFVASLATSFIAMLYKESAVVAPLLVVLVRTARDGSLRRAAWDARPWLVPAGLYLAHWAAVRIGPVSHITHTVLGGSAQGTFATMSRGFTAYAAFVLLPVRPTLDWYLPASRTFAEDLAWLWALAVVAALTGASILAARGRGASRAAGAAALWGFVALLPVANWPVYLGIPTAERFLHVALAGFGWLAALCVRAVPRALPAVALAVAACAAISFRRAGEWKDDTTLWDATARTVESPRAEGVFAERLRSEGLGIRAAALRLPAGPERDAGLAAARQRFERALAHAERSLALVAEIEGADPPRQFLAFAPRVNASNLSWLLGRPADALRHADLALEIQEDAHFAAHYDRALALLDLGSGAAAFDSIARALELGHPPNAEIASMLARAALLCDAEGARDAARAARELAASLPAADDR